MKIKIVKAILISEICLFLQFFVVKSRTCGELENKIKSYEDEIKSLQISQDEYELIVGRTEDVADECNEFLTCSSCLWEKKDLGCGWCVLRNTCSLSKNCPGHNSSSDFWVTGSDRCPKIRAVIPHNIAASRPTTLQIIIPHLPDYDGTFICSFEVPFWKTLLTKGTKFDRGITCPTPRDRYPRTAFAKDYKLKLSIKTPNGPIFASTSNLTVYDCNRYETCTECSASIYPCAWCIEGKRCTHDVNENCRNDIIVFSKSVTRPTIRQGPGYCPRMVSYTESENEILVPSGSKKRIFVKLENLVMLHVSAKFSCKVKAFPAVNGQLLGDTLYCEDINLRVLGRQPLYNLSFSVFWDGDGLLDNPPGLHVVVYHCERMAKNCGECIDLPARYNCGWCEETSSCSAREYCPDSVWMTDKDTCRRPEIISFYPNSGLLTATNLTIEGVNLAKEFKDIKSIQLIDEEGKKLSDCIPYEHLHVRHSKIVCLLDPGASIEYYKSVVRNNETLTGFIEIRLSNDFVTISEKEYSFVDPTITGFQPVKGMMSGGTTLKISGYHLDAGTESEVYIGDLPCHIISRDWSNIRCITSPIPASEPAPKSAALRVLFDGEERTSSSYFFYVGDPGINSVKGKHGSRSPVGTPSGGDLIIVEGTNFDYVPNPYVYVVLDGVEYPGACTVVSETRMECLSPVIPAETLNSCHDERYLPLHYGFKMGGAQDVQNISLNNDFQMYALYPEPHLMPFNEEGKIKTFKSDYLVIQGNYLDTVYDKDDYTVTVGDKECRVTSLGHTQLTCHIPNILLSIDYDENRLPRVLVKIHSSREYFIGFLRFEKI